MPASHGKKNLVFFPSFKLEDAAEFTDQYFRVMFYVAPVCDEIDRIVFAVAPGMLPGQLPDYLDPAIAGLVPRFEKLIQIVSPDALAEHASSADFLLHWDTERAPPKEVIASVEVVDRNKYLEECQVYLNISSKIGGSYSFNVEESRRKFEEVVKKSKAEKCYIFGTGPNLSLTSEHDFSDGVAVACNSMVKNTVLLDKLRPPLIVAGDPIFHAGASVYAAEFRTHLYRAMERYDAYFLTNQRDYRIFYKLMPTHLRSRLIGAPADWGLRMNIDPLKRFVFTACPNILTLFLMPLAFALSEREIWIAGCDGRPVADNKYFWQHDTSVQFSDKMSDIQRAHPSFFDIDYDDYYFLHCETVNNWIRRAEKHGRTVINMTPSFIPALAKRYRNAIKADEAGSVSDVVPLGVRAAMKRIFLQRQWRVIRQGVVPAWRRNVARAFGRLTERRAS